MSFLTATEIAEKQIANATSNVDAYRRGVQRTTKNPMQLAIKQLPKMKRNFNKAIDDGKVEAGLNSVSEAEWKELTAGKGADNYPRGLEAAKAKTIEFHEQLKKHQEQILRELEGMPNNGEADGKKRMLHNYDRMSQFKFLRRPRR